MGKVKVENQKASDGAIFELNTNPKSDLYDQNFLIF